MTPEIRLEAIKLAHTLHTDVDLILASANKFIHFVSGTDAPPAKATKATKNSTEQTQPVTQPSTASAATPSAASTAVAQEPAASTPSKLTLVYDDVKKLILKLAPLNREAALKVFADHGVAKGPDLKPEQYDSAHKALSDAIAAHEAAKA